MRMPDPIWPTSKEFEVAENAIHFDEMGPWQATRVVWSASVPRRPMARALPDFLDHLKFLGEKDHYSGTTHLYPRYEPIKDVRPYSWVLGVWRGLWIVHGFSRPVVFPLLHFLKDEDADVWIKTWKGMRLEGKG